MIFNILSFIAILQGAIQISDLSYIFYQSNKIQLTLHDFETLKLILSFPWIIKPIWGFCSDIFPIAKYKRKPYLFIFAIICFLLETFMAVSDVDRKTAFVIIFLIQLCIVFCNVIAEAVLVEQSHELNTSQNVALFFGMRAIGGYFYTYIAFNFPIHRNSLIFISITDCNFITFHS
ncbi:unnamed protein product [Paramecium sonneborni]|uniref:Uncharacterized protein n=1 Tax=Paramecium sonneborni TaxID=65129 RepID=A0A8S1N3D3_9CILI|nr:unnamed protein product [Paramecium sonneborni]